MAKVAPEYIPPPPPLPPPDLLPPLSDPIEQKLGNDMLVPLSDPTEQGPGNKYTVPANEVKIRNVELEMNAESPETYWRHGEIFFEETGQVCKYLLIPDHVSDPMDVVSCLFTKWGMKKPNMVCSVASGIGDYMEHDTHCIECPKGKINDDLSLGSMLRDAGNGQANWDEDGLYEQKVTDIMHGVCAAEAECGGWLLGKRCCRWGSSDSGAAFSEGCSNFYKSRPTQKNSITYICAAGYRMRREAQGPGFRQAGLHDWSFWTGQDRNYDLSAKQLETCLFYPYSEPQDLASPELAVPIEETVKKRLSYPFVKWDEVVEWPNDCPGCLEGFLKPGKHHDNLGYVTLNPYCTHLLIGGVVSTAAIDLLQAIFPSVLTVLDFKCPSQGHYNMAFEAANRGATVLLMQNMGISVNVFVNALKDRQQSLQSSGLSSQSAKGGCKGEKVLVPLDNGEPALTCQVPDGTELNKFIVFDALTVSKDTVVDKLTKALTVMAGDNVQELNHSQNEKERIVQAWALYMKLKYNAIRYHRHGCVLQICIALTAFASTCLAVLFTASNLNPSIETGISTELRVTPEIHLSSKAKGGLAFVCAVLPLASTFLLSCSTKFNFDQKYSTLMSMAVKIQGEIYKYRTKSGIYQPRSRNEALDSILGFRHQESGTAGEVEAPRKLFSSQVTSMVQRARTVCSLSSLCEPPQWFKAEVTNALFSQGRDLTKPSTRRYMEYCRQSTGKDKHPLWDIENVEASGLETNQEELYDDGILVITAEDYVKMRLLPSIKRMQDALPQRSLWFTLSQILVFTSTLVSGVLGFLGLSNYIPVTAALASCIESISSYSRLRDRLTATNTALTELQSLLVWYRGLSMVERRLLHNKNHLVDVTEAALVAELAVISSGGGDAKPVVLEDDADDKDNDKGKFNDKGKEKKQE